METDATKAQDTAQIKSPSSDSSIPSPSSSADVKREKDVEEGTSKNQSKKGLLKQDKMEVTIVKVEAKKEKMDSGSTSKPSRPSSTPPCNAGKTHWQSLHIVEKVASLYSHPAQRHTEVGMRPMARNSANRT